MKYNESSLPVSLLVHSPGDCKNMSCERRGEGGREGGNASGRESGNEEREGREGKGGREGRERAGGTGSNTCFLASTLSLTAKASLACFRNGCLLSGGSNQSRTPFSSTTSKSYSVANILDRNPVRKSTTCQTPDKYRHRERAHPSAECYPRAHCDKRQHVLGALSGFTVLVQGAGLRVEGLGLKTFGV